MQHKIHSAEKVYVQEFIVVSGVAGISQSSALVCSLLHPSFSTNFPLLSLLWFFHTLFLYSFILLHTKDILRLGTKKGREKKKFVGNKKKRICLQKKSFGFSSFFSQYVQKIYKNLQKFVRLQKKNEFFDFKLVIYAIYICIIHTQLYNICRCVCVCFVYVCLLRDTREVAKEREEEKARGAALASSPLLSTAP